MGQPRETSSCTICAVRVEPRATCSAGAEGWRAAVVAYHRGQVRESLAQFAAAFEDARGRGDALASEAIAAEWARCGGQPPSPEAGLRARAFGLLAAGEAEAAGQLLRQAAVSAPTTAPYDAAAAACWEATAWRWALGRLPFGGGARRAQLVRASRDALWRACRAVRRCGFWVPHVLVERAVHAAEAGRVRRARRHFSRAIRIAVERQDQVSFAWATFERGRVGQALGWPDSRGNVEDAVLVFSVLGIDAGPLETYRLALPSEGAEPGARPSLSTRFQRAMEAGRRIVACLDPSEVREEVRRNLDSAEAEPFDEESRLAAAFIRGLGEVAERNARAFEEVRSRTASLELQSERLRASLEEKEVMLKEIQHRVKNNLQLLLSLLSLQAGAASDPSVARELQELENRVRSMALIQDFIYGGSELSEIRLDEYLRTLTEHLAISFGVDRSAITITYALEPLRLDARVAVDCGLIATELVSNVFEHAFQGRTVGTLRLRLARESDGTLVLGVADDGVGMGAPRRPSSLGLTLVSLLAEKLGTGLEVDGSAGTSVEVRFTLRGEKRPAGPG